MVFCLLFSVADTQFTVKGQNMSTVLSTAYGQVYEQTKQPSQPL
jgi:hypothetical protein